jgi:PPM family protein phosphatase
MEFDVWGQTDVGLKRDNNQDSILVDKKHSLFIVADGMGGHKGGEVASALAIEAMQEVVETEFLSGAKINPKDLLRKAYREATRRIFHKSTRENPELMGMGTTMVSAFVYAGRLYVGNVGDSRAYLYRDGNLWQITDDHSLINEQIRAGVLDPNQPEAMIGRNVITRSVGFEDVVDVDIVEREVSPGEIYLLCSDGLSGLISNDKISEIIKKYDPSEVVAKGIEEAKKAGGDDNISVIVFLAKK